MTKTTRTTTVNKDQTKFRYTHKLGKRRKGGRRKQGFTRSVKQEKIKQDNPQVISNSIYKNIYFRKVTDANARFSRSSFLVQGWWFRIGHHNVNKCHASAIMHDNHGASIGVAGAWLRRLTQYLSWKCGKAIC